MFWQRTEDFVWYRKLGKTIWQREFRHPKVIRWFNVSSGVSLTLESKRKINYDHRDSGFQFSFCQVNILTSKRLIFYHWHRKLVQLKTCPCPGKQCPWNEPVRKVIYWLWQVKSNSSWLGTSRAFRRGSNVSARICRKLLEPIHVNFTHNRVCPTRKHRTFWTLYPLQIFPGWLECTTQIIQTSGAKTDIIVLRHLTHFI